MDVLMNWFEIPAADFSRAVNFYKTVFGIEIYTVEEGEEKMGFFPKQANGLRGAISFSPGFKPCENGVLINFHTGSDVNIWLKKIEKAGGKTLTPKTKIEAEGEGYFATFMDSEGNRIGLSSDS